MTDATTGPGAEGAPRDGKLRGRAVRPAAHPGHDPVAGERAEDPRQSTPEPGDPAVPETPGHDPRTGRDPLRDTAPGTPGGPTAEAAAGLTGTTATSGAPGGTATPDPTDPATKAATPAPTGSTGTTGSASDTIGAPGSASGTTGTTGVTGIPGATRTPDTHSTHSTHSTPGTATGTATSGHDAPLLPREECDQLAQRLQHAVVGFVDEPRDAVAEADRVLEEAAARFNEAVTQRRSTLRGAWQGADGGPAGKPASSADTEQLRLALRDYRELADRLLHL
jgi:hypothetical protein